MTTITVAVILFTAVVVLLASVVLLARRMLMPSGRVTISINRHRQIEAATGRRLLTVLGENGIYLPSACGGRGTCGECRVTVTNGARPLLPTEAAHISARDARAGQRLACMLKLRGPLDLALPNELLDVQRLSCTVTSNYSVSTFLKELTLALPGHERLDFEAGDYVMLEVPPYELSFADLDIPPEYRIEWQRLNLLSLDSSTTEPTSRLYSLANAPHENDRIVLVVRIAIPPPRAPAGAPPGKASSYLFGLSPGDRVAITGPYGDFHATDRNCEMVLIGGGAGIAPLRSIIRDQLARGTKRKISLWYGSRDLRDLCYREEFEAAATAHENFSYHVALSQPRQDEDWDGPTGFVHSVVHEQYLKNHPAPTNAEYYLCGPPLMSAAVAHMLEELGVSSERIFYDDFGT